MDESDPKYDRLKLTTERNPRHCWRYLAVWRGFRLPVGRGIERNAPSQRHEAWRRSVCLRRYRYWYTKHDPTSRWMSSALFQVGKCLPAERERCRLFQTGLSCRSFIRYWYSRAESQSGCPASADRESAAELLNARGHVDLLIPRGKKDWLICPSECHCPGDRNVGAGVCHAYFDRSGDVDKGAAIIRKRKLVVSVYCNTLDWVAGAQERVAGSSVLCGGLSCSQCDYIYRPRSWLCRESYPAELLPAFHRRNYGTGIPDYKMAVKGAFRPEEAVAHIARYGSGHENASWPRTTALPTISWKRWMQRVFMSMSLLQHRRRWVRTGCEIGISTQKLHARGPMGLEELNTYKWIVRGEGQTRD